MRKDFEMPNNDAALTDVGAWPSAGDDDLGWEERLEHELAADFPGFDICYGVARIKDERGSTFRAWSAQCQECGAEIVAAGPIKLRNAMKLHAVHYVRRVEGQGQRSA